MQLSDPTMIGLTPSDDGRVALGTDDRAYRHMVDYDGTYNDVYLVDTATGARKLALKQFKGRRWRRRARRRRIAVFAGWKIRARVQG